MYRSGSINPSLMSGPGREFVPEWCILEKSPLHCSTSSYSEEWTSKKCNIIKYNPQCIELLAIDAAYVIY